MIHAFLIGSILFLTGYYFKGSYPKWAFYGAFLLKALATIAIGNYFLEYEKSGDTLLYFSEALRFNQTYTTSFIAYLNALMNADIPSLSNNWHSQFFVKLISPITWLSQSNYWTTALYLTLINFVVSWYCLTLIVTYYQRKWLFYLAFFTLPSAIAWSGGVFKESISNACFLLLLTLPLHLIVKYKADESDRNDWITIIVGIVAWLILLKVRFYLAGLLIIIIPVWVWFRLTRFQPLTKWSVLVLFLAIGFFSLQLWHPYLRPSRLPLTFYENYQQILIASKGSETAAYPMMDPSYIGLFATAPLALITGIFRPLLFEFWDFPFLPFQLEKTLFLILFIASLFRIRHVNTSTEFWIGISTTLVLATSLAIASPNFGSLMRYQSVYTPLLAIILGFLPLERINSHFK